MGFRWSVKVRITPTNGLAKTITLDSTTLPDGRGPMRIHPSYVPEEDREADVLREMRRRVFGWRVGVEMDFDIITITSQATIAEIQNALSHPEKKIELSLDGGTTYREVIGSGDFSPERFNGKWTRGARYPLGLTCKKLLTEVPAITSVDGSGNASTW